MTEASEAVRRKLVENLLSRIDDDKYPSVTMLDMVESLLTEQDVAEYADVLLRKAADEQYPSLALLDRLRAIALS